MIHSDTEAQELIRLGEGEKAITVYERMLLKNPESFSLKSNLALAFSLEAEYEKAEELFVELLEDKEAKKTHVRIMILNNIVSINLALDRKELLHETDRYSGKALRGTPRHIFLIGTSGMVLVEMGEIEQGKELLEFALKRHSDPRAGVQCDLAVA